MGQIKLNPWEPRGLHTRVWRRFKGHICYRNKKNYKHVESSILLNFLVGPQGQGTGSADVQQILLCWDPSQYSFQEL